MFVFRHALGSGLLLLAITPAFAQSVDHSTSQIGPFHDASIGLFSDVWRETIPEIERQITAFSRNPIVLQSAEQTGSPSDGEVLSTSSIAELPRLLPTLLSPPSDKLRQLPSLTDSIHSAETGLLNWLLGMLGVVGLVALGGVYWVFHARPALGVRHATDHLRLTSALSLPRRTGLFLVDVENQSVLVAMNADGIRQVVSLDQRANIHTTRQRVKADKAPRMSSPSASGQVYTPDEVAFRDFFEKRRTNGNSDRAVQSTAKFSTRSQTATAHSENSP